MGDCQSCCQSKGDTHEVDLAQAIKVQKGITQGATDEGAEGLNVDVRKIPTGKLRAIIKLQSLWRGKTARRMMTMLRAKQMGSSKYFTQEEARETVTKNMYNPNMAREQRPAYTFKSGATYTGQWKGGFRDGFGEQTWNDGAKYSGEWSENRAHGKGRFIHVDGDIYDGYWANDKANGRGTYKHVNGAQYEGLWKDDLQHGYGVETWTDKSRYDGDYAFGRKHGIGAYLWNDGSKYTGHWFENKISGLGVYSWLDGREYMGEWLDNNMEGIGIYKWNDGRIYMGQYKDDKKHGFGIYTWADQRSYEGYWYKGKQHGLGTYIVTKENKIKFGLWEDGKRIEWFNETQVQALNNNQMKYTSFFHHRDSEGMVEPHATYFKPQGFDDSLNAVQNKIQELDFQHRPANATPDQMQMNHTPDQMQMKHYQQ